MSNYRQVYLDVLEESNPQKLAHLRRTSKLESVLQEIDQSMRDEEVRLTRELATASLGGRDPSSPQVNYQESVQAMNQARVSAREILTQQLVELATAPLEPREQTTG
jgi:hypothetical protein